MVIIINILYEQAGHHSAGLLTISRQILYDRQKDLVNTGSDQEIGVVIQGMYDFLITLVTGIFGAGLGV